MIDGVSVPDSRVRIEVGEEALEARVTLLPGASATSFAPADVRRELAVMGVRAGIDDAAIGEAVRRRAAGSAPVVFVAARGERPRPPAPERLVFVDLVVPPRLQAAAARVLPPGRVPHPRGPRGIDFEASSAIGFAARGAVVAAIQPGSPGVPGRSVFGLPVAVPPAVGASSPVIGEGLVRAGASLIAAAAGFVRRGAGWCDLVPFRDHEARVTVLRDGRTCVLDFAPGEPEAPLPDAEDLLCQARSQGIPDDELLPAARLTDRLRAAAAAGKRLVREPLTLRVEPVARVDIAGDRLTATLTLVKGQGGAPPLTLDAVAAAVRASGVRGFDAAKVRDDILAFHRGPERRLEPYVLARGKKPGPGRDGSLRWTVGFLPAEAARALRALCLENAHHVADLGSLAHFPLEQVEAMAIVHDGAGIMQFDPGSPGAPGVDVCRRLLAAPRGAEPRVRLFDGLSRRGDLVVATAAGLLEKAVVDGTVMVRVRPHRDAVLQATVSDDRMRALLRFGPAEGTGRRLAPAEVRARLAAAGVVRGLRDDALAEAIELVGRNQPLRDLLVAEGRQPSICEGAQPVFHAAIATGRAVTIRPDGRADFRRQDRYTTVRAGDPIATIPPAAAAAEDGWDVTGRAVPAAPVAAAATLEPGRNVNRQQMGDGSVLLVAGADGELVHVGAVVEVREVLRIDGDVGLATGDLHVAGAVSVSGAVRSGSTVEARELRVEEGAEACRIRVTGSLVVARGIVGEDRAIVDAGDLLEAGFAERATLRARGDIVLHGACLRCTSRANGRLILLGERGRLVGGAARARLGVEVQDLGSTSGTHTMLSFGQDYLVGERVEEAEREAARLQALMVDLDRRMREHERSGNRAVLERTRDEKREAMKAVGAAGLALIELRDSFDEHAASEVVVRGTLFPGAVVESHGRRWETRVARRGLRLAFDPAVGRIVER